MNANHISEDYLTEWKEMLQTIDRFKKSPGPGYVSLRLPNGDSWRQRVKCLPALTEWQREHDIRRENLEREAVDEWAKKIQEIIDLESTPHVPGNVIVTLPDGTIWEKDRVCK